MADRGTKSLGELQATVLAVLWDSSVPLSVRDVLARLERPASSRARRGLAYTTVLTVLTRLYEQEVIDRDKRGRAFFYRPRMTRAEWVGARAAHELHAAGGPPSNAVLAAFLDSAERTDPALLDHLSTLIAMRRRGRAK
jgi:predicted transcriptional regulator